MHADAHHNEKPCDTHAEIGDVAGYDHEQNEHGTHVWTHSDTGLQVELTKTAGRRDGYGRTEKGYRAVARDRAGGLVDQICGSSFAGYLPGKQDALQAVTAWMQQRPDGELRGDEEVEY